MSKFIKNIIPQKGDSKKERSRKIVLLAALTVLIVCIIILLCLFLGEQRSKRLNDDLAQMHSTTTIITTTPSETAVTTAPPVTTAPVTTTTPAPKPLVVSDEMKPFVKENPETAGWINVDTGVDNVVMQTTDNEKYLTEDFYGRRSQSGTVFADYRSVVNDYDNKQSDNIILYGHNQKDNTMFGTLKKYKVIRGHTAGLDYYKDHPTFTFSNLYETYTYKIIAVFVVEVETWQNPTGKIFDYQNFITFNNIKTGEYTYDNYMKQLMSHTAFTTGVDVKKGDQFMTLSTCSNEFDQSRLVIVGRKVRDGESSTVDTTKAAINPDAIEPDWNYIYNY
jgi:sortase B